MTLPQRYTLTIKQGDTLKRWWRIRYKNGTVANLATVGGTTPAFVTVLTTTDGGVGVNEVKTISLTSTANAGTFTLTFAGQTTTPLAFNSTAAQVQTALTALSSIGTGNLTATGGSLPGTLVTVTFVGTLAATNVGNLTAITNLTSGGYNTGRLTIRDTIGGTIQRDLTTANGEVVINYQADADGAFWSGYLSVSATTTGALTPWGDGKFDFEITNGIDVMTVMEGPAFLNPGVTT
jgi:hypothetical protein